MIPIAQIKKELRYSLDLADIIDVLKLIASSEFSNLASRKERRDIIKEEIISCFYLLKPISKKSPFLHEREHLPKAYLLICSDEGFLGEVNNAIVDIALRRGAKKKAKFIVLGERGQRLLRESGVEFVSFPGIENDIPYGHIIDISNYIMELYRRGTIGSLYAIYMKFLSFNSHSADVIKLLPCDELVDYIGEGDRDIFDTLLEPNEQHVMEYLIKLWLENSMYNIFWSSKLSEWSIRVLHLERGSDELKEINKDLRLQYFKSLHGLNDKIIREITAARRAV